MMCRVMYIYKITSPTGRVYVGKTINPTARFNQYKNLHCGKQRLLFNSLNKYGFSKHDVRVVAVVDANLSEYWEQYWIRKCNSYKGFNKAGMNLTLGGEGTLGKVVSEVTRSKIGAANRGRKVSQETRDKIAAANRFKKHTPKTIAKILKSRGTWTHSEDTKKRMSEAKKGVPKSDSFKEKRRAYMLGRRYEGKVTPILDTESGIYYDAQKDAAWANNVNYVTFSWRLRHNSNNRFIKI